MPQGNSQRSEPRPAFRSRGFGGSIIVAGVVLENVLLLVRHGRAEEDHPLGDSARGLLSSGRDAFRAHAGRVAERVGIMGVVTSPLVRAVQTGEILAGALGTNEVAVRAELAPAMGLRDGMALARELGAGYALVGHNPAMGALLARLIDRDGAASFAPGAIAALVPSRADRPWKLLWCVAPGEALP